MERSRGIGGVFFRSNNQAATVAWYEKHLGLAPAADFDGSVIEWSGGEQTIWGAFAADTDYFGPSGQDFMVNYIVDDLDAMLAQLRAAGVEVDNNQEFIEGVGTFGWAIDCDGRRFELWEPPAQST